MQYRSVNPITISPDKLHVGDMLSFRVVAVIGNGDWAAYRGSSDWDDEQIAKYGDKISKDVAAGLFYAPQAAKIPYRR